MRTAVHSFYLRIEWSRTHCLGRSAFLSVYLYVFLQLFMYRTHNVHIRYPYSLLQILSDGFNVDHLMILTLAVWTGSPCRGGCFTTHLVSTWTEGFADRKWRTGTLWTSVKWWLSVNHCKGLQVHLTAKYFGHWPVVTNSVLGKKVVPLRYKYIWEYCGVRHNIC